MSPTTPTPTTAERYATANGPLTDLIDNLPADDWERDSPCDGWTARDVLRHMIETQRQFLADHDVELPGAPDIDADPAAAWRGHSEAVLAAISDERATATGYEGHFGPTTVGATLEQFHVFDMVAHRWDLSQAAGRVERFTDAELDQLEAGITTFGDSIYMQGVCVPGVEVATDADRQDRVLATLGRQAR
ncbi:MAG: maleylpyruvate isomerase family mycothiol-dependent enzyme [Acidimicrobiia bacterium]|nr:maleylpyruvate isomerase family mycothiol-dependent enzyme [Acidimicrobiia bacterium]